MTIDKAAVFVWICSFWAILIAGEWKVSFFSFPGHNPMWGM